MHSILYIRMIVHYNHDKPTMEYVVNSRLPVYKAYYGDGLGKIIAGLFTRMAPKVAPFAKQIGMKAIDVIRDKGLGVVGDLAGKAFTTAKDKIVSLVKSRRRKPNLPSTAVMPANVSRAVTNAVVQKLASLETPSLMTPSLTTSPDTANSAIMNAIAGSGLKLQSNSSSRRRRK